MSRSYHLTVTTSHSGTTALALREDERVDGVHDLGGMHGFGPVPIEVDEPLFHEPWEGRVAAMARLLMANTTVDHFRSTIEQMPPAEYLSSRYYERWLWAAEHMAAEQAEQGLLDGSSGPDRPAGPSGEPDAPRRFADGEQVVVANAVTAGHTRVPRYLRNHVGTVVRRGCVWSHPTSSAATGRYGPVEHVYLVAFRGSELFGPDARHTVMADVWERDLEPITGAAVT
jgi:nitrile hydratase